MRKLSTIRTVQAAGRRRRCVPARSRLADFARPFGADGFALAPVSHRGYQIREKSGCNLQLTVRAGRRR